MFDGIDDFGFSATNDSLRKSIFGRSVAIGTERRFTFLAKMIVTPAHRLET